MEHTQQEEKKQCAHLSYEEHESPEGAYRICKDCGEKHTALAPVPVPVIDHCKFCGKTVEDHRDEYKEGEIVPRMPCKLLKSGFIKREPVPVVICGRCQKTKGNAEDSCNCGRPSKYNQALIDKAMEYLEIQMPNKATNEVIHSLEGLAVFLKIAVVTVHDWRKDKTKPEFSYIVNEVLAKQGMSLVNGGLVGKHVPAIAKVMMTKHGYRDAVENYNTEVPVDPEKKKLSDRALKDFLEKQGT